MTGELPDAAAKALAGDGTTTRRPGTMRPCRSTSACSSPRAGRCKRKLFAAMAQQDCGQCGYLCESYSAAIAAGTETKLNLCVPGGKETSRMLKRLLEDAPAATPATVAPAHRLPSRRPRRRATAAICRPRPSSARPRASMRQGSEKDTRHVVIDICGLRHQPTRPATASASMPTNDPRLVDAVLAAMRAPADFPIGDKTFRQALIEDYALGAAPDALFELISFWRAAPSARKAKLLAKGEDPDGDAATFDVLAALEAFGPIHPDPEAFLECLEPLQPRLYSISSSPLHTPGEVHLTVDAVRYDIARPHAPRRRLDVSRRPADRGHAASRSTCRRRTASRCRMIRRSRSSWSGPAPASRRSARSCGSATH